MSNVVKRGSSPARRCDGVEVESPGDLRYYEVGLLMLEYILKYPLPLEILFSNPGPRVDMAAPKDSSSSDLELHTETAR